MPKVLILIYLLILPTCAQVNNESLTQNATPVVEKNIFGVTDLEWIELEKIPKNMKFVHRGLGSGCSEQNCERHRNLFAYYGYRTEVLYTITIAPVSESCPLEDDWISWKLIGAFSECDSGRCRPSQNICTARFKKEPQRGSGVQFIKDVYLSDENSSEQLTCQKGYRPIAHLNRQLFCMLTGKY